MSRPAPTPAALPAHLSLRVWALAVAFEAHLARELAPLGLGVSGFRLVGELMAAPDGLRTGELARRLGVKPPSVTALVARLVDAGVVEVRTDARDRRAARVCLTASAPLGEGMAVFERLDARLVGQDGPEARRVLSAAVDTLLAHLGETP